MCDLLRTDVYETTITADVCSTHLSQLHEALKKIWLPLVNKKGVILQHDNAKTHIEGVRLEKSKVLGWNAIMHSLYFLDNVPSDFNLFLNINYFIWGKQYDFLETLQNRQSSNFHSNPVWVHLPGIDKLVNIWQQVIKKWWKYTEDWMYYVVNIYVI